MTDIAMVYALFADRAAAEVAAVLMVERRLAACANIQADCMSVYRWDGKTVRAAEAPVIFKTSLARRAALIAAIAAAHDYETPAITSWTAATTADYGAWVEAETQA